MTMNQVLMTLSKIMEARGYSESKLAQLSSVSQSTLNSLYQKNNMPSIPTLTALCQGLGITLSEFFKILEHELSIEELDLGHYEVSESEIRMQKVIEKYLLLPEEQKKIIESMLDALVDIKEP